jgi:hypothetical protein
MTIMREAYDYALVLQRSVWDFAVEIAVLRRRGLSNSALRCLVCQGLIEHRAEVDTPDEEIRRFVRAGILTFSRRTCFVLTQIGMEFTSATHIRPSPDLLPLTLSASAGVPLVPEWDKERQELRVDGLVVKQFKVRAPNQETILAAFQEEDWPPRIDDPLPPRVPLEQDSKRRLHDTIINLNRHHKNQLIRFTGDGTGEGVRWELLSRAAGSFGPGKSTRTQ